MDVCVVLQRQSRKRWRWLVARSGRRRQQWGPREEVRVLREGQRAPTTREGSRSTPSLHTTCSRQGVIHMEQHLDTGQNV